MIFAAGIGSRLKHWTDHHPKALVEVGGVPMLGNVINKIRTVGVRDIVVNVHHFADQVEDYLKDEAFSDLNICVSDERELLLDTGGGLLKAAEFLSGDEPIIVHNADIFSNFDLNELVLYYNVYRPDTALLVSTRKSSRALLFDVNMRLQGWQNLSTGEHIPGEIPEISSLAPLAFSGIQIISPRIFRILEKQGANRPFSITNFYANNCPMLNIMGYVSKSEYYWFDVGKPETLEAARSIADKAIRCE